MRVLAITRLRLKSYKSLFGFFKLASQNVEQARLAHGFVCGKTVTSWSFKTHFTITLWESNKDMQHFMGTGSHLDSMRVGPAICNEMASVAIQVEDSQNSIPSFRECESLIRTRGRLARVQQPSQSQKNGLIPHTNFYFEGTIK
jgi:hypothetical protein